jgi:hypothetical protein
MHCITSIKLRVILLLISITFHPGVTHGSELRTLEREIDPVEVSGNVLSQMTGAATENIRVFASRNKTLLPIPFQIDQKSSTGDWVWSKVPGSGENSIVASDDEESGFSQTQTKNSTADDQDPRGKPVFDSNDILVFMASDTGDRYSRSASEAGMVMVELKISDPQKGTNGWVYVVRYASEPPARAKQRYVSYQESERRIVAPSYQFIYSAEHSVMLEDLKVDDVSILEQSKIRGKVKAGIGPLATTMEFDEQAIDGYDAGYINGPIRVIKRSIDHVKIAAGMRSPDINCDHYYYPWHAEVPMLFSMRFPVKEVEILVTSKYRKGVFQSAGIPRMNETINIDNGKSSANLLEDKKDARLLGLYGDGLAVLTLVKIPGDISSYFDVEPYLANYSGQALETGYLIQTKPGIAKGEHVLHSVFLILADSDANNDATKAINLLENKLHVEAIALQ